MQTTIGLGTAELELDDVVGGFSNAALWEGSHSCLGAALTSAPVWERPSIHDVAAGGRSANSSMEAYDVTVIVDNAAPTRDFLAAS